MKSKVDPKTLNDAEGHDPLGNDVLIDETDEYNDDA
jgi:hypothetical protein